MLLYNSHNSCCNLHGDKTIPNSMPAKIMNVKWMTMNVIGWFFEFQINLNGHVVIFFKQKIWTVEKLQKGHEKYKTKY